MKGYRSLGLYPVIAGLVLLVSVLRFDWMMLVADTLFASVVYVHLRKGFQVPRRLFLLTTALFVVYLVVSALRWTVGLPDAEVRGISWVWIFELFVLFVIVFIIGFLSALMIDMCTPSKMSLRWMLVFAIVATIAFSAVYLFALGFDIWYSGRPFGYDDIETYGWEINVPLMVPSTCAIIVAVASALMGRVFLKGQTKESLIKEV